MWQTGSATDYFDLLKQLEEICTSRHMATAAISAGGTGYVVGDILTIAGGTSTHVATIEVVAVAAGVITQIRITTGGAYSVDPTTTGNAVTGGTGTSATINLTMANTGWTTLRKSKRAASAVVAAGGTGYAVNDEIEVDAGLGIGSSGNVEKAVFVVATLSGSAVATVTVKSGSAGIYEETPSNPASTTATVGTGTGCTLTVSYADINDDHSILVMRGAATGAPDGPVVGLRTYEGIQGVFDVRNWALFGFATWNGTVLMHNNAGISPGLTVTGDTSDVNTLANRGCPNLPLKDNDGGGTYPLGFWMSVNDRRIVMVVHNQNALISNWVSLHLGFLNQFGATNEIPYPMLVAGSAVQRNCSALDNSATPVTTSIVQMGQDDGWTQGPGYMLTPASQWRRVSNFSLTASNSDGQDQDEYVVYPFMYGGIPTKPTTTGPNPDAIIATSDAVDFRDMTEGSIAVTPAWRLFPTPDSVENQRLMIPCTVLVSEGPGASDLRYPFGEMQGVYWFSYADGGPSAGPLDFFDVGSDRYRVFRTGHRTELDVDFFAILEA